MVQKKLSLLPGTSDFVFPGGFKENGTVSRLLAVGVRVCRTAGERSALAGMGRRTPSLALAFCWHLPPARGAVQKCKDMQGLRSLLNSRKAASWAKLKVERRERRVVSAVNPKWCHSLPDPKGRGL